MSTPNQTVTMFDSPEYQAAMEQERQRLYGAEENMSKRDTRRWNRFINSYKGQNQLMQQAYTNAQQPVEEPKEEPFTPTNFDANVYLKQNFGENASRRERRFVRKNQHILANQHLYNQMMTLYNQQKQAGQQAPVQEETPAGGTPVGGTPVATPWKHVVPQANSLKGATETDVVSGNTLSGIVSAYNRDNQLTGDQALKWQDVATWNNITADNKYMIKPGQKIRFTNPNAGTIVGADAGAEAVTTQKQGGLIKRHQQGGQQLSPEQQELQYALVGYIVATKKQPKDENEIKQLAQQLIQLKQQDPQKYNQLVQLGQKAQAQKAEKGAKLNYIKSLKGLCPDGEELVYFKKGGMIDCGCQKKEKGGEVKQPKKANAIEEFKKGRKSKKC